MDQSQHKGIYAIVMPVRECEGEGMGSGWTHAYQALICAAFAYDI